MKTVTLKISHDEALVLHEFLSRSDDQNDLTYEHEAEQKVVWNLEAQLDRYLVEPFVLEYRDLLDAARSRVLDAPIPQYVPQAEL